MDVVHLSQGYRATTKRQFTFYKSPSPGTSLIGLGMMKGLVEG